MRLLKLPPDRWAEFRELRLEALRTDPDAFGARYETTENRSDQWWIGCLETALLDPARTMWFAEIDGKLVGMAGAYPEEDPANVDITSMFVTPEQRRKGIARALLRAVVEELEHYQVQLCVNGDQTAAVALYREFGFFTIAETPLKRPDGSDYVQLYMRLKSSTA